MSKIKLIETQLFTPKSIIRENTQSNLNPIVDGILATVDTPNGNGRYYSREIWERELEKYIEGPVRENRALGELDHADNDVINLKNASHIIKHVWWDGDNIMGKVEILPTPSGNILKTLLENKVLLGISSRGMGSVIQTGELLEVQDDFELVCWDFVSTPSNPGSWMRQSLNENKNYLNTFNKYSKVNNILNDIIYNI